MHRYVYDYACHLIPCILPVCFFCVYTEKEIRHNWTKQPYVDLHFDQPPSCREPVCQKNVEVNIILLKKFCSLAKRSYDVSLTF